MLTEKHVVFAEFLFCQCKPIAFLLFLLTSPSSLKEGVGKGMHNLVTLKWRSGMTFIIIIITIIINVHKCKLMPSCSSS